MDEVNNKSGAAAEVLDPPQGAEGEPTTGKPTPGEPEQQTGDDEREP